ncbi:hypothetical protein [Sporolactobacillus pectinivorans]|uniref:hypothetical protein n=1 Tax=Sporolactobacillus pectinivorans TaxID=1591408 RepID=UPI0012FD42EE|nr:hypothetical protein [Sporolactobacillus pectinivorans]
MKRILIENSIRLHVQTFRNERLFLCVNQEGILHQAEQGINSRKMVNKEKR